MMLYREIRMLHKSLRYMTLALMALPIVSQAQKVMPALLQGNKYTVTMGPIVFKSIAKESGRIGSVSYNGNEVLSQDSSASNSEGNYGSTFWPSPQAYWTSTCRSSTNISCFPPLTALDGNTDTAKITADSTIAFSTPTGDTYTRLRFGKKYWGDLSDSSINIQYTMYNTSTTLADTFSAWEDTRIPAGGIYLFPNGPDTTTGALAPLTRDSAGITWFKYDSTTITSVGNGTNKFYRTAGLQGWYAHIDPHGVLFIKKFNAIANSPRPPSATKEKQIEFYANNTKTLIEMELQGPFLPILPSDSMVWTEKWYVRQTSGLSITVGNPAIVSLISQITGTTPPAGSTSAVHTVSPSSSFSMMDYATGRVSLNMTRTANVSVSMVNSRGQIVSQIHSGLLSEGRHDFTLDAGIPKGIYWLVVKSPEAPGALNTKMIVRF